MAIHVPNDLRILARVANRRSNEVEFVHEPVGMVYPMPAGAIFDVVAPVSADGYAHVEVEDGHIIVYAEIRERSWVFVDGAPHPLEVYP